MRREAVVSLDSLAFGATLQLGRNVSLCSFREWRRNVRIVVKSAGSQTGLGETVRQSVRSLTAVQVDFCQLNEDAGMTSWPGATRNPAGAFWPRNRGTKGVAPGHDVDFPASELFLVLAVEMWRGNALQRWSHRP